MTPTTAADLRPIIAEFRDRCLRYGMELSREEELRLVRYLAREQGVTLTDDDEAMILRELGHP